jgi:HEAT repeat protein
MGKDGFPPLLTALGNPSTKYRAAYCMVEISAAAVDIGPAMPALLLMDREMRYDSEEFEKANPAAIYHDSDTHYVLSGLLEENRPFLIPALNNCLHHTNSDVRVEAAGALGSLGDKARPAVPALREALDDRVIAVQEAAIIALEKIAPEVLTNGVKEF